MLLTAKIIFNISVTICSSVKSTSVSWTFNSKSTKVFGPLSINNAYVYCDTHIGTSTCVVVNVASSSRATQALYVLTYTYIWYLKVNNEHPTTYYLPTSSTSFCARLFDLYSTILSRIICAYKMQEAFKCILHRHEVVQMLQCIEFTLSHSLDGVAYEASWIFAHFRSTINKHYTLDSETTMVAWISYFPSGQS